MSSILLITRPRYDETTNYLYYWAELVVKEAKNRNFEVIDLAEQKANYTDFAGRTKKVNPNLIFFNGHGNPDVITGHNGEILVSVEKDIVLLKDKIIYALACSSAKNLGEAAIKNGAESFIGYKEDFIFMYDEDKSTRPKEDNTAKLFLEPSNLVMTTLIKHNTSSEAFKRSQKEFTRNIRKLMASESLQEDKSPIPWLYWDMTHQVCLGEQSAKL